MKINNMNKVELVAKTAEVSGLTKKDVEVSLKALIDVIEDTVASGDKVQLVGFGTFEPRERKEREVPAHPGKAGDKEKKIAPASVGVGFKVGKEFKEKVAK